MKRVIILLAVLAVALALAVPFASRSPDAFEHSVKKAGATPSAAGGRSFSPAAEALIVAGSAVGVGLVSYGVVWLLTKTRKRRAEQTGTRLL